MTRKSRSGSRGKLYHSSTARVLWAVLLLLTLVCPYATLAADEECDNITPSPTFTSPADNLCVPAISSNATFVIDGVKTASNPNEWATNTYYEFGNLWNAGMGARVWVSRKARGINKSDLYLLFEFGNDAVPHGLDEVRIGLNPGTNEAQSTLIKIHPSPIGATPPKEVRNFNTGTRVWNTVSDAWLPSGNIAFHQDVAGALWSLEVQIPLDQIPTFPITAPDFRLSLQIFGNDGSGLRNKQWPDQSLASSDNDMCSNPNRWHPMSFSTGAGANCPHPDLNIAGGLYSCGDVYILRGGAKSTEIAVNQMNEFHADVTNPHLTQSAPGAEVYLTLLALGTGTSPQAMNYSHTDSAIRNFFTDKYGAWMTAGASLSTGTPKPPPAFTVNANFTNTAARFNWKPSDEPGDPTTFLGHRCTAAFVNYKDDPNFANNFSYCNTSIVSCPTGEICPMAFAAGQVYPNMKPRDNIKVRMFVNVINEPFPGWFNQGRFNLEGGGIKRINEKVFEVALPAEGEMPFKVSFTPPRGRVDTTPSPKYPTPSPRPTRSPNSKAYAHAAGQPPRDDDPIQERNQRLKKIYGDRPIILIEQYVPTSWEWGLDGKSREQLYASTSYVAFVVDTKAAGAATPTPKPKKRSCGKASGRSFALSSMIVLFGIVFTWRRARRRTKAGKTIKNG